MKFLCIIVLVFFLMLKLVLPITSSKINETLKEVSSIGSPGNKTLIEHSGSENKTYKRVFSVSGITPSVGILEHLEKRLGLAGGIEKLEHVEDALSRIYKLLNLDLPICKDHSVGSKEYLVFQFEGLRNKTKELEIFDALVSLQQLLKMMENMLLAEIGVFSYDGTINDGFENVTDSVHYLRWKRLFKEAKNDSEILRLITIFHDNATLIEDFCRCMDSPFAYSYGPIEATGLLILPMPDVKERLLRCGEKYEAELKLLAVLARLQVMDDELFVLFTTEGRGHQRN